MYLKVKEAAEVLRCSTATIRRMIEQGKIDYIELGSGVRKSVRVILPEPQAAKPVEPEPKRARVARPKRYEGTILSRPQRTNSSTTP